MTRWASRMGSVGALRLRLTSSIILVGRSAAPAGVSAGAVLVTVDVYPQRDGKIVEGLTAADFEVLEDGKPQTSKLEFVRVEPGLSESERRDPNNAERDARARRGSAQPRVRRLSRQLHVAVEGSHAIRRPLVDTLDRIVAPNDLFGVMTQNIRPRHLVLGRRLMSVEEQLTRYWPWGERNRITRIRTIRTRVFSERGVSRSPSGTAIPWKVQDDGMERGCTKC